MLNKAFAAMLLAPLAAVSLASAAGAAPNPIPGVDIIVRKCPTCLVVTRTRTGRDGRFAVEGLTAGTYSIRVAASFDMPRNAAIAAMHSRSNIKRISTAMAGGAQVVMVDAESDEGPAEAEFRITAPRGRVVGVVTRVEIAPR